MGHFFVLLKIILQLSSKIYWAFKKREIVNIWKYFKYFQNKNSETDISSATGRLTI